MKVAKRGVARILATEVPEWEREQQADREGHQGPAVLATDTKHTTRTDRTPKNGGGEKGVDTGASEVIRLGWRANAFDLVHLEVENADADKGRDERRCDLSGESVTRWDLAVVTELEIR